MTRRHLEFGIDVTTTQTPGNPTSSPGRREAKGQLASLQRVSDNAPTIAGGATYYSSGRLRGYSNVFVILLAIHAAGEFCQGLHVGQLGPLMLP